MAKKQRNHPAPMDFGEVSATVMAKRGQRGDQWYWRARTKGTRRTVWTGWASLAELAVEIGRLLHEGLPSQTARRSAAGVRTVGDLMQAWADAQEGRQEAGEIAHRSLLNYRNGAAWWRSALGDVLASKLDRATVEDQVLAWRRGSPPEIPRMGARTAKVLVNVLHAAVRWGHKRGHCPEVDLGRLVTVDPDEFVYVSHTPEAHQAASAIARLEGPRDFVALLALTGCRVGEAAAARVGDYNPRTGLLALHGRDPERQRRGKVKVRHWPVTGELRELLDRRTATRDAGGYLFPEAPRDASEWVNSALAVACAGAEVPRFSCHGLRRMVTLDLLDRTDPKTVSKLTGHSVQVLLESYVRPTDDRMREVVLRADLSTTERPGKVLPFPKAAGAPDPGTSDDE